MNGMYDNTSIPKQAISESKKTQKWYKENIKFGASLVNEDSNSGLRASRAEKISNVNLFNDIIDRQEIDKAINPMGIQGKFPDNYKNYPIANSSINLLFGEERRRLFNPTAFVVNGDLINSQQDIITNKFKELIAKQVMNPDFSEEQAKKAIQSLDKWRKYTFQDMYSRMSNQVIQYFMNTSDIKEQWSKNFEDLLIQGEEIMSIDIVGDSILVERIDPLDVTTYRSGDSYKVEDSDWIIISRMMPIGSVIDNYHDYLTNDDKKRLEEIYTKKGSDSALFKDGQLMNENFDINESFKQVGLDKIVHDGHGTQSFTGDFDSEGNVRVTRTLWKGQRRIGILTYKDEEGKQQKKYVDEKYKPNKENGENVKWEYISEWNEGTEIAGDIYVKYGPRPIQFRDPDNPSLCHPGIVGNILNTNSSKSKSLLGMMKPYQLEYNFFMHRLNQDFIKYQGHIAKMDLSSKPDGWSIDKIMYFMSTFGLLVEDKFNEGLEGAATGKLSGHMNQSSGSMQIGDSNIIQMNMMMLDFLENRIADISGVTPQRKGAVENRETKGGIERSVMQSSNSTEKYYSIHDNFKLRCLKVIIGTASVAWRNNIEKRAFVLDDGTKSILDFDGQKFNQGVYGVATNTSSDTTNMMNDIKALSQPFMQNGGSISAIMDIYQTKDPASLKRKMEQYEEELKQEQQQQQKQQMEAQQQQIAAQKEIESAKLEHERFLKELESNTKLQVEAMKLQANDGSLEMEKLNMQKEKILSDAKLAEKQLAETERHNKAAEQNQRMSKLKSN